MDVDFVAYVGDLLDQQYRFELYVEIIQHDFWCQVGITALLTHDAEYAHGMHLSSCIAKGCALPPRP